MHRHPGIGDNQVSTLHRRLGVALELDLRSLGAGLVDEYRLGVKLDRAGEGQIEAELPGGLDHRGGNVVAIARPHHLLARDRPVMLLEGQHIGHDLAGMGAVGQPVDHRHRGMLGQLQQRGLVEGADHDQVNIAAEHPRGVGDALAMAKLHLRAGERDGLAPHLPHPDIEAHPGPGRGFLEDQRDDVVLQRQLQIGGALGQPGAGFLHLVRKVDHRPQLCRIGLVDIEEMSHVSAPFTAAAAASSFSIAVVMSSSEIVSAGSRRTTLSAAGTVNTCCS